MRADVSFFNCLQETAKRGDAESEFILGLVYSDGWNGTISAGSFADRWRDLGTELDDHRPTFLLQLLQRQKDRVAPDQVKALQYLTQAADQGDNYARVMLGEMLLEGTGVKSDWFSGSEWIRKSAVAGFAPAQFRLGVIYLVGNKSTPHDDIESLAWFIVAAEAGSKSAQDFCTERTQLLGNDAARQAFKRSRGILALTKASRKMAGS